MKQLLFLAVLLCPFAVNAASVTEKLAQSNDYKLFNFVVDSTRNAVVRTFSYSDGANAEVKIDLPGGCDPELVIFDNEGTWLDIKRANFDNDNEAFDSYKAPKNFASGKYAATLRHNKDDLYQDLFPMPSLALVTWHKADKDAYGRYSALALSSNASPVPVPTTALLFSSGLLVFSGFKRRSSPLTKHV
jgi:hypothetical protein